MGIQKITGVNNNAFLQDMQGKEEKLSMPENQQPVQEEEKKAKVTLEEAIEDLNNFLKPIKTSIQFVLHEELEEYFVQVVNVETNEVLREIPPKKMLDIYAAMAELMGLIVDRKI
ncbi:flagellar protein FlaG [Aeribacillus pallidus]|uniref:flagellar protein FlaG n=1 Tax=Aeribacillus sp. FSL W8-0870 TaxID=2954706 RepID=UPI0028710E2B|nr:flagellar protein FlaG [Aeribacillus pallidus]